MTEWETYINCTVRFLQCISHHSVCDCRDLHDGGVFSLSPGPLVLYPVAAICGPRNDPASPNQGLPPYYTVPSGAPIFACARGTKIGGDTVTTLVMTSPKPTILLSPSATDTATFGLTPTVLEAHQGGMQVGNWYSVPVKAFNFLFHPGKDFTCQKV